MKKFLKSVPFALLVLPLVAGCGKNGPTLSKKGQIVSEEIFGEALDAALEATIWENEDYKMLGGVLSSKTKETSSKTLKRDKKVISSSKTTDTSKSKYQFDGTQHILVMESKSKSKTVNKGVGIKKDKHVEKRIAKNGLEAQALYAGKANALVIFDHVKKEYNLDSWFEFEDASELDKAFQEIIKDELSHTFQLDPEISEKGTLSLYQNGKIFSYEYKYTDLIGSSDNGGYYNEEITTISKGQLNLNPGKYEVINFTSVSKKRDYIKNVYDYIAGDVYEEVKITESSAKGKEKKVNLKNTKASKYKDAHVKDEDFDF